MIQVKAVKEYLKYNKFIMGQPKVHKKNLGVPKKFKNYQNLKIVSHTFI